MTITIKYFGQLRDITRKDEEVLELDEEVTVARFKELIHRKAPALKEKTYKVACNKKLVDDAFIISTNDEIALLPPFSGG